MLIGHLPGIAAAMMGKRLDPLHDPNELYILAKHADYYKFKTYPWGFWAYSALIFTFSCLVLYFIIYEFEEKERSYGIIFLNILTFYISFLILYSGKIETLLIDRKVSLHIVNF